MSEEKREGISEERGSGDIQVYRELSQVVKALSAPEVFKLPQVEQLLTISSSYIQLFTKEPDGKFLPKVSGTTRCPSKPFIVLEGLDGSGKTTMTKFLQKRFGMELYATPPKSLSSLNLREFFDSQPQGIRRAYYALGNYLAAEEVRKIDRPVVVDRFWHSTAAYGYANFIKNGGSPESFTDLDLSWPLDLLQPNLVVFLELSEEARLARHSSRQNFTNTVEEQALAADKAFRDNVTSCFKRIAGVPFVALNVDGSIESCEEALTECVLSRFPAAFAVSSKSTIQAN